MSSELQVALTALITALATALAAWARSAHAEKKREPSILTPEQLEERLSRAEAKGRKDGRKELMVEEIHQNSERILEVNERAAAALERAAVAQEQTAEQQRVTNEILKLVKDHMDGDHAYQARTNEVLEELLKRS